MAAHRLHCEVRDMMLRRQPLSVSKSWGVDPNVRLGADDRPNASNGSSQHRSQPLGPQSCDTERRQFTLWARQCHVIRTGDHQVGRAGSTARSTVANAHPLPADSRWISASELAHRSYSYPAAPQLTDHSVNCKRRGRAPRGHAGGTLATAPRRLTIQAGGANRSCLQYRR